MLKISMEKYGNSNIPPWRWGCLEEKEFTVDENDFMIEIIDRFGSDVLNDIHNISDKEFELTIQIREPKLIEFYLKCEEIS